MTRRYRPLDPFERGGPFEPREIRIPRPPRRFWFGVGLVGLAVAIFLFASPIVWFFTELQWYDALGLRDVFTTRLALQVSLIVASLVVSFAYLAANVLVALRIRSGPSLRAVGIRRPNVRSVAGFAAMGSALLVALILAGNAGGSWQSLALFMHSTPTGIKDPVLEQDVAFYLLSLPFLHSIVNWALGLTFLTALLVAAMYVWRGDSIDLNPSPLAIGHLSALLGVLAVVIAGWMWLGRYDLLFAHNSSIVWGAAYTDVNARLPLNTFQAGADIVLAGALIANVWLRRRWLPLTAAGAWIAMLIIAQAYPSIIQGFFVTPSAQTYELLYIEREIVGTRAAYGLTDVTTSNFTGDAPLTAQAVQSDQVTINNLRLWDFAPLINNYEQLQTIRTYYTFHDIDIDRYTVNSDYTSLEISAREFDPSRLSPAAQNWVNEHLVYTHGYGVAASPVNAVVGEGLPDYIVHDIPPSGDIKITQPAIYFGEVTSNYGLAPSGTHEFDYPQGTQDVFTTYTGTHGVPMTPVNRALWSLKLGDFNLLVSPQITSQTEMLYRRSILDRAEELAPFLKYDRDPYVVVVDGKIYWIIDAYTTGATYPYSQEATFQGLDDINYIRNSVKVVIDAYEGTATFYIIDGADPIIRAYQATFPSLFKPIDAMPAGLRAHLRVPVDLFQIQTEIYATYHISDPRVFFSREDVWDIPTAQSGPTAIASQVQPYYVLVRLPGEQNPEFLLIMPFTPRGKQNLSSWLAARSDGSHYGEYISYVLPKDKVIYGPQQVANLINQDPNISRDFSLFDQAGSSVQQGNLLVVPIGNSFLYFEPVYLKARQSTSLPELKKVILADQTQVAYADTLQLAIAQLVGNAPPTNNPPPVITPAVLAQIADLVNQANLHYATAYTALKSGDLTTFATEMNQVGKILKQLQQLTGTVAKPTPSPSASPSP